VTGADAATCCQAVTVTGQCSGNTDAATDVDCTGGDGTTAANTENKGATVIGTDTATCCQAVTKDLIIADLTTNLATCKTDLEARRLARLAEAADDLAKFEEAAEAPTESKLNVNAECDPRNDDCDAAKELVCDRASYKCKYAEDASSASRVIGSLAGAAMLAWCM
jgi:hypothetical protein